MTKKYNSPMLQVVSISKKDIIVTSLPVDTEARNGLSGDAPSRFRDFEWYGE